jgi:hypothetical protein
LFVFLFVCLLFLYLMASSRFQEILEELHKTPKSPLTFDAFANLNVASKPYTPKGAREGGNRNRDGGGNYHNNRDNNLKASGGY